MYPSIYDVDRETTYEQDCEALCYVNDADKRYVAKTYDEILEILVQAQAYAIARGWPCRLGMNGHLVLVSDCGFHIYEYGQLVNGNQCVSARLAAVILETL